MYVCCSCSNYWTSDDNDAVLHHSISTNTYVSQFHESDGLPSTVPRLCPKTTRRLGSVSIVRRFDSPKIQLKLKLALTLILTLTDARGGVLTLTDTGGAVLTLTDTGLVRTIEPSDYRADTADWPNLKRGTKILYSAPSWEPHPWSAQMWITQPLPCQHTTPAFTRSSPGGATTEWTVSAPADEAYTH